MYNDFQDFIVSSVNIYVKWLFLFRWRCNSPATFCVVKSWANHNIFTTRLDLRLLRFQSLIL